MPVQKVEGVLNERNGSKSLVKYIHTDAGLAPTAGGNVVTLTLTWTTNAQTVTWTGPHVDYGHNAMNPDASYIIFQLTSTITVTGGGARALGLADVSVTITQTKASPYATPFDVNQPMNVVDVDPT